MKNSILYEVKKEKKQLGKTALELEPVSWRGGGGVEGKIGRNTPSLSFVIASLLPGEGFQATAQGGGDPAEPDSLPELRRKC